MLHSTCVCLLKCLDAQFSMSVSDDGFLRLKIWKIPQLALGIIFLMFRLLSNWTQAPRSSDCQFKDRKKCQKKGKQKITNVSNNPYCLPILNKE